MATNDGPIVNPLLNTPNLMMVVASIILAGFVGDSFGNCMGLHGTITWNWGFWIGFILTWIPCLILVYWIVCLLIRSCLSVPCCRQGTCCRIGRDYIYPSGTACGWIEWGRYNFRCKCGDEYLRRGKQFLEVLPGNDNTLYELVPYKKLQGWRRWVDDIPVK